MRSTLLVMALLVLGASPAVAQTPLEQPPEHRDRGTPAASPRPVVRPGSEEGGDTAPKPAPKAAPAPPIVRDRGILASLSFGVNGCTDHECDPLYPMVYVRVHALYRVFKYLAVGLHTSFNFFVPGAPSGTKASTWQLHVAPEVRGLYSWRRIDFWTAITLGYVRDMAKAEASGVEYTSWEHGFGFGWGVGAQYFLMSMVAVGVDFWLYKGVYGRRCSDDSSAEEESCGLIPVVDQKDIGVTWAVGVTGTFFWGL